MESHNELFMKTYQKDLCKIQQVALILVFKSIHTVGWAVKQQPSIITSLFCFFPPNRAFLKRSIGVISLL